MVAIPDAVVLNLSLDSYFRAFLRSAKGAAGRGINRDGRWQVSGDDVLHHPANDPALF